MRQYRITAPGFVIIHLTIGETHCLATTHLVDLPLTRAQGAEMLRNARRKGYRIERTLGVTP